MARRSPPCARSPACLHRRIIINRRRRRVACAAVRRAGRDASGRPHKACSTVGGGRKPRRGVAERRAWAGSVSTTLMRFGSSASSWAAPSSPAAASWFLIRVS